LGPKTTAEPGTSSMIGPERPSKQVLLNTKKNQMYITVR
jgi:hypothetical protein